MRLTKSNYERVKSYQTLKEALDRVDLTPEELAGEKMISLGIGRDWHGTWYAVGHEDEFASCYIEDLQDLSWYEKGWIETPAPDYEYEFTSQEELDCWLEWKWYDRDLKNLSFGDIEGFDGTYYSVADIKRTAEDCPCSEDNPYTIYEWA